MHADFATVAGTVSWHPAKCCITFQSIWSRSSACRVFPLHRVLLLSWVWFNSSCGCYCLVATPLIACHLFNLLAVSQLALPPQVPTGHITPARPPARQFKGAATSATTTAASSSWEPLGRRGQGWTPVAASLQSSRRSVLCWPEDGRADDLCNFQRLYLCSLEGLHKRKNK